MKFTLTFKTPDVIDQAYDQLEYCECDCGGHCVDCDRLAD